MFDHVKHGDWFAEKDGTTYVVPKPEANLDILGPDTPVKEALREHYDATDFRNVNVLAVAQYLGLFYVPGHDRDLDKVTAFLCGI